VTRKRAISTLAALILVTACAVSNPVLHATEAGLLLALVCGIPLAVLSLAAWCAWRIARPARRRR
jgi:hypothetical protein